MQLYICDKMQKVGRIAYTYKVAHFIFNIIQYYFFQSNIKIYTILFYYIQQG